MTPTGLQLENPPQVLYLVCTRNLNNVGQMMEKGYKEAHGKKVLGNLEITSPLTLVQLGLKISYLWVLPSAIQVHIKIHTMWNAAVLIADSTLGVPHRLPRHMLHQFAVHFRSFFSTCCICGDESIRSKIQDRRK